MPLFRNSRWLWLKGARELSERQREDLERLSHLDSKTGRAYQIKLPLQRLWSDYGRVEAEELWYFRATHGRLAPIIEAARTIKRYWQGVLQFVTSRITTGIVEGLNSKIKTAIERAYSFNPFAYLRTMISPWPGNSPPPHPLNREENQKITGSINDGKGNCSSSA